MKRLKVYRGAVEIGSCLLSTNAAASSDPRDSVRLSDGDELQVVVAEDGSDDPGQTVPGKLGALSGRPKPRDAGPDVTLYGACRLTAKRVK